MESPNIPKQLHPHSPTGSKRGQSSLVLLATFACGFALCSTLGSQIGSTKTNTDFIALNTQTLRERSSVSSSRGLENTDDGPPPPTVDGIPNKKIQIGGASDHQASEEQPKRNEPGVADDDKAPAEPNRSPSSVKGAAPSQTSEGSRAFIDTEKYDEHKRRVGRLPPIGKVKKSDPPTQAEIDMESDMNHSIQLYRHEVTRCFLKFDVITGVDGDNFKTRPAGPVDRSELNAHAPFNRRVQCYCAEKHVTKDNFNCAVRVRNALTFRHPTMSADIYVEDSPFPFEAHIDNARESRANEVGALLRATMACPTGVVPKAKAKPDVAADDGGDDNASNGPRGATGGALPECGWVHDFSSLTPYDTPLDFNNAPLLYIPSVPYTTNHYHSSLGPGGVLQIVNTRAAINKFYYDMNGAIDEGNWEALEDGEVKISPINNNYRDNMFTKHKFGFQSPRVTIASRGSCSLMDFNRLSAPDDNFAGPLPVEQAFARTIRLPMSFLSREMIYRHTFETGVVPNYRGPFYWFGRRMGFCFQEMPQITYATSKELWVNVIKGQTGAIWLESFRRPEPIFNHQNASKILLAEDYMNLCPVSRDEIVAARYGAEQMGKMLDIYAKRYTDSSLENPIKPHCLRVTRETQNNGNENYCVLVVARFFSSEPDRGRGLPALMEHAILTGLLMKWGHARPKETPKSERIRSWYWDTDEKTQQERCLASYPPKDGPLHSNHKMIQNAYLISDRINFWGGRAPCSENNPGPKYTFKGVFFAGDPSLFDVNKLRRLDMAGITLVEQHQQVKYANLFIFEEGAPLMWAYNAPYGSTFIIVYNSNVKRMNQDGTMNKRFSPFTDYFFHFPALFGRVRMIFFVTHYGRMPAMSKLREAFDKPWKPESIVIAGECDQTRLLAYDEFSPKCDSHAQ